jgi:hypothetical protein
MQDNEYKKRFAINQSAIKDFRFKSPQDWKAIWIDGEKDEDKDDEDFIYGSLVDTLWFSPERLEERFHVTTSTNIPQGAVRHIVKAVHASIKDPHLNVTAIEQENLPEDKIDYNFKSYKSQILQACAEYINEEKKKGWNPTWKDDTRYNKIVEQGEDYFNFLIEAKGREVISAELNLEAIQALKIMQTNEDTRKYFTRDDKKYTNIFQLQIFMDLEISPGIIVPVKCAIDDLHLDHEYKTIQVVDGKTSFSAFNFIESIKRYSYCDQVSFYQYVVERYIKTKEFRDKYGDFRAYRFKEPINIVIDRKFKTPYIYEYDWKDISISREGNYDFLRQFYETTEHFSRIKKGWMEIIREIAWHMENKKWDYPMNYYEQRKIKVNLTNS